MPYSVDISYYLDNLVEQEEYDDFFEEFSDKIEWYASDCGPFTKKRRKTDRIYRSNAYKVKNIRTLQKLCRKICAHDKFFVERMSKHDDECNGDSYVPIFSTTLPESINLHKLNPSERKIHEMLTRKE